MAKEHDSTPRSRQGGWIVLDPCLPQRNRRILTRLSGGEGLGVMVSSPGDGSGMLPVPRKSLRFIRAGFGLNPGSILVARVGGFSVSISILGCLGRQQISFLQLPGEC
jgi:hypothetical protein